MKNSKSLLLSLISVTTACVLALVGFSFAWYTSKTSADKIIDMQANGVLIIYFEENIDVSDTKLKPAVAKPDAIRNNVTDFNVLDGSDPNIDTPATTVEYNAILRYINAEEGTTTTPSDVKIKCTAKMIFKDGSEQKLSLIDDIIVSLSVGVQYATANTVTAIPNVSFDENFRIEGDGNIHIDLQVYLAQPDELCNPYIREAQKIVLELTVTAEPVKG
mgnify:FL=1